MLEIFKARLRAKSTAAGSNLSQKRIDALADRLHKKFPDLTEEKDHDENIDLIYDSDDFKELAGADDFQRQKEAKEKKDKERKVKEKADQAKKKKEGDVIEDEEIDEDPPEKMPDWFKPFADKMNKIDEKDKTQSLFQKLKGNAKLKDIPEKFWDKRKLPETDEEIESFANEVNTDWTELAPETGAPRPIQAGTGGGKASDTQIENIVDKIMPK